MATIKSFFGNSNTNTNTNKGEMTMNNTTNFMTPEMMNAMQNMMMDMMQQMMAGQTVSQPEVVVVDDKVDYDFEDTTYRVSQSTADWADREMIATIARIRKALENDETPKGTGLLYHIEQAPNKMYFIRQGGDDMKKSSNGREYRVGKAFGGADVRVKKYIRKQSQLAGGVEIKLTFTNNKGYQQSYSEWGFKTKAEAQKVMATLSTDLNQIPNN